MTDTLDLDAAVAVDDLERVAVDLDPDNDPEVAVDLAATLTTDWTTTLTWAARCRSWGTSDRMTTGAAGSLVEWVVSDRTMIDAAGCVGLVAAGFGNSRLVRTW